MQGRDPFVVLVCCVVLARLEEAFHSRNVAYPRQVHNVRPRLGSAALQLIGCQAAHLHVAVEFGSGDG